ncbi:MAG: DNA polymerase III subunit beta [Nitrospirae bacterium GWC2_57_13]|jgi:DNA polymerase III subunit beta|nr:MAG: DNA polymerase III subunit beta [Nitrospirae bacterium GWC2_57_13]OGW43175.1 MAG: DNA polymerase III subunit beta [Nitrospirae bacterium GWD2_57_8]
MKLKIKKDEFLRGLQRVQGVVEKRNTMPILSNMLLTAAKDGIEIVATDLEIGLRGSYAAEVKDPGAVCVSAKKLFEIVREVPEEEIQIETTDANGIKISSGHAQFKLVGLPQEEYPALPEVPEEGMIAIEGSTLRDMIRKTLYAVGDNDTRYVLNGLFVQMLPAKEGLKIRMVGTDGHRLSMVDRTVKAQHAEETVIIPKKAMMELRRLLEEDPSSTAELRMGFSKNHALFKRDGLVLVSKLIDGNYPNYQQVVPAQNKKKVSVGKDAFAHAVKRVSILSREKTNAVKMQLEKNRLILSTNNPELGEAVEELAVDFAGEGLAIGFNSRYVMDVLGAMDKDTINLELNDPLSPCLITEADDPDYRCVVMPMRV